MQIGILPYAGVDIATFEVLKEYLLDEYDGAPPPYCILGAGMISSSIAQFASYPLALVRTRLQVAIILSPLSQSPSSFPGLIIFYNLVTCMAADVTHEMHHCCC